MPVFREEEFTAGYMSDRPSINHRTDLLFTIHHGRRDAVDVWLI